MEHERGGHGRSLENQGTGHTQRMQADTAGETGETDPVCGMKAADDSIESSYLGRTFHFCSQQCKKLINLNLHKYANTSQNS